ncbi:MAG: sulfatase [Chloroflexi bacterium]|nr:sulfatase [Chloroflexota bacterium]
MRAIMLMYDSLNRRMLSPYQHEPGAYRWVMTPNFTRLAEHAVTFDTAYVGSMPCMPARRELHTGRYNFLHRSWGPLEPFDDSLPEILKKHGITSHLASDHYHYWEDGGCTYHNRYSTWESFRGQEGDAWIPDLRPIDLPQFLNNPRPTARLRQDWVNRLHTANEEQMPQPRTFQAGIDFLRMNHAQDDWFLTIETFDPHEPYFSSQRFQDLYPHAYHGQHFDWPNYARVVENPDEVQHMRCMSAALHSMCDWYLGRLMDVMDELDLWKDTLLIVNTDHGFLLGEHDWWAKVVQPFWDEVAHTPLFIWDPRCGARGERRKSLVQTIDLPATLLAYFGVPLPADMQGNPLRATIADDTPVREAGLFGLHGAHVNVTDGRYVYMRANATPENTPLYEYTLMPTHMTGMFSVEEFNGVSLAEPFSFTKGCHTMRIPARAGLNAGKQFGTYLYDLADDPLQERPLKDARLESRMIDMLVAEMRANDAPPEQYVRLGLTQS